MIDCHCHLCDKQFDNDLDEVIDRAQQARVTACIVNTENQNEFEKVLQLAEKYENWLMPCFGVHPVQYVEETGDSRSVLRKEIEGMREKLIENLDKIVAIGEVGLDYTPHFTKSGDDKLAQQFVLKYQIDLANEFNLPLNVHSRSAGRPVIDFLLENGAKNVVLHAFSGNYKSATPAINAGYYFSVPPCSINSDQKRNVFDKIPLEQLLLETDSPVLGPTKGERNEPANIKYSCEFLAEIKKCDIETVHRVTTENALNLFPKLRNFMKMV